METLTTPHYLLAVLVASVMGSLHCVGMCGPFALWASGAAANQSGVVSKLTLYHLGRLITYTVAATLVGVIGMLLTSGGSLLGWQSLAARVAGAAMMVIAIVKLARWLRGKRWRGHENVSASLQSNEIASPPVSDRRSFRPGQWITQAVGSARPMLKKIPEPIRPLFAGSLTTLLPCGWLYVFLLVAAGTGSVATSIAVMASFWLGTIPALTTLALGALRLTPVLRPALPVIGAGLLFFTGLYTATGRASADLTQLNQPVASEPVPEAAATAATCPHCVAAGLESTGAATAEPMSLESLKQITEQPLPCCADDD
ncbi:MAG: sulfite exporter TauE/SafE family protein [Planctomycetota bacterium]